MFLEWVAFSSPEDLPDAGITPKSPVLQVDSLPSEPPGKSLIIIAYNIASFLLFIHLYILYSHEYKILSIYLCIPLVIYLEIIANNLIIIHD